MLIKKTKKNKAFSLMEVILSIFVLTIGLTATLTLMSKNVKKSMESRNKIIATMLAQEGNELMINARDTRMMRGENSDMVNLYNGEPDIIRINQDTLPGVGAMDYKNYMKFPIDGESGTDGLFFRGFIEKPTENDFILNYSEGTGYLNSAVAGSAPTTFKRYLYFWYGGDMILNPSSLNTCHGAVVSKVCWGGGTEKECVRAEIPPAWEKNPLDPRCDVIDNNPAFSPPSSLIDYR